MKTVKFQVKPDAAIAKPNIEVTKYVCRNAVKWPDLVNYYLNSSIDYRNMIAQMILIKRILNEN